MRVSAHVGAYDFRIFPCWNICMLPLASAAITPSQPYDNAKADKIAGFK